MSALSMMRDTCTVSSRTDATDSAGGPSPTVATSISSVRVMLDVTSSESFQGGRETPVLAGQAYFPFGTSIDSGDYFTMNSGQHSGLVFAVLSVPTDDVGRGSHLVCEVESKTGSANR